MNDVVGVPLWLVIILAIAALASVYRHIVVPLAKAALRAREQNLNDQLRSDLSRKLPQVLRIGRNARIELFVNSPEVRAAITQAVSENQGTRDTLDYQVREYAGELIPGFYSLFYFKIGYKLARAYIHLLYDLRIAQHPPPEIANIPESASVVLVGNHRSNLDVMMLAYLASRTNMVSFAAGEWGKAWPMSAVLHMSGSYIIRRNEPLPLYRKILAIHMRNLVKMKMPQGIFLEGGLTRDGSVQPVKLGLLSYLLSALDEDNVQDIVFIPVAFNYTQVPEDKTLLKNQQAGFSKRSKWFTLWRTFSSLLKVAYKKIRLGKTAYGTAAVSFGTPVSMQSWLAEQQFSRPLNAEQKKQIVSPVADQIISQIIEMIPALPISVLANALSVVEKDQILTRQDIAQSCGQIISKLKENSAVLAFSENDVEAEIEVAIKVLLRRKVIRQNEAGYQLNPETTLLLNYLHNSTSHLIR